MYMFENLENESKWKKARADFFWSEIAPCDHVLQIYENEENFSTVLRGFVQTGLDAGDGVVIIATEQHLKSLNTNLAREGYNLRDLYNVQYFPLDAHVMLSKFMVNGWPDEQLFMEFASGILKKARISNKKIRAFGEMVAILWENGDREATRRLEELWNKFCENEMFCLFCAYPKKAFERSAFDAPVHICQAHSKLLAPEQENSDVIRYSRTVNKAHY